jgi:hypothetical protein
MSKNPGSLPTPTDRAIQTARDDAEPAVLAGRREGTGLPLAAGGVLADGRPRTAGPGLEITARGLEDAFLALTGDGPSGRNEAAT